MCIRDSGKTWTLTADSETKALKTFASADEADVEVNSPMQTVPWDASSFLVLYSGAGGKEDGRIIQWSTETKKPVMQWPLAGIKDPMGMARIPGTDEVVIVDNNWSLTAVNPGSIARLPLFGANAGIIEILRDCLLYTSPSPRDRTRSRMPSSA